MTIFGNALNLLAFLNELPSIAQRADNERLSVMLPAFKAEFPQLWEDIVYCAQMDSPALVIAYLCERDTRLGFLKQVPNVEPTIQFLMNFIRERSNDDSSNHPDAGNAVHANRPTRRRQSKRVHAGA
jgi:hypothetical protein